jgi:hypothetical protein
LETLQKFFNKFLFCIKKHFLRKFFKLPLKIGSVIKEEFLFKMLLPEELWYNILYFLNYKNLGKVLFTSKFLYHTVKKVVQEKLKLSNNFPRAGGKCLFFENNLLEDTIDTFCKRNYSVFGEKNSSKVRGDVIVLNQNKFCIWGNGAYEGWGTEIVPNIYIDVEKIPLNYWDDLDLTLKVDLSGYQDQIIMNINHMKFPAKKGAEFIHFILYSGFSTEHYNYLIIGNSIRKAKSEIAISDFEIKFEKYKWNSVNIKCFNADKMSKNTDKKNYELSVMILLLKSIKPVQLFSNIFSEEDLQCKENIAICMNTEMGDLINTVDDIENIFLKALNVVQNLSKK